MLTQIADPTLAPEVLILRDRIRSWRFYDSFRTDEFSPARQAQIGTHTSVLFHDGRDLAAALQTIIEIGDVEGLETAIEDAFPGAKLWIEFGGGRFQVAFKHYGLVETTFPNRALGWNVTILVIGCGVADTSTTRVHGAKRAGDESTP